MRPPLCALGPDSLSAVFFLFFFLNSTQSILEVIGKAILPLRLPHLRRSCSTGLSWAGLPWLAGVTTGAGGVCVLSQWLLLVQISFWSNSACISGYFQLPC